MNEVVHFNPETVKIQSAAVHDDCLMFTATFSGIPGVLFGYDKVKLKEGCDGSWYVEYSLSISAEKNSKVLREDIDQVGSDIIQYLFDQATK